MTWLATLSTRELVILVAVITPLGLAALGYLAWWCVIEIDDAREGDE